MKILFALSGITHSHIVDICLFFQEKFDYLNLGITCFHSICAYAVFYFFFNNFIEVEFFPRFFLGGGGYCYCLFFGCTMWHVGFKFPDQRSNLRPLQWEVKVLTTSPPGKPPYQCFGHLKSLPFTEYFFAHNGPSIEMSSSPHSLCKVSKLYAAFRIQFKDYHHENFPSIILEEVSLPNINTIILLFVGFIVLITFYLQS